MTRISLAFICVRGRAAEPHYLFSTVELISTSSLSTSIYSYSLLLRLIHFTISLFSLVTTSRPQPIYLRIAARQTAAVKETKPSTAPLPAPFAPPLTTTVYQPSRSRLPWSPPCPKSYIPLSPSPHSSLHLLPLLSPPITSTGRIAYTNTIPPLRPLGLHIRHPGKIMRRCPEASHPPEPQLTKQQQKGVHPSPDDGFAG
jgi:hypothetical protein